MTCARLLLAASLALAPAASGVAQQVNSSPSPSSTSSLGASSGASAAFEPPDPATPAGAPLSVSPPLPKPKSPSAVPKKAAVTPKPPPSQGQGQGQAAAKPATGARETAAPHSASPARSAVTTGSVTDRPSLPLTNVGVVHIELLPMQGEPEKCGLDAGALQAASTYPVAASARLKVARGTLTHMHVRLSAIYVRRLEHCIVNADVRVSSLQSVELQHSRTTVPLYVPLWEKADVRLVPRAQAQKLAEERLRKISEQFLIDWAAQN